MGAVPIVMAAVSAAGTYASISSQQSAVRNQNAAISAQISANKDAERLRQYQARIEKQIIEQQGEIERQAIRTNAASERQNLINQREQLASAQKLQAQQIALQRQQLSNDIADQQNQLAAQERDLKGVNAQIQQEALNQVTNQLTQLADPSKDIQQIQRELSVQAAQMKAYMGSRGRTSSNAGKLTPEQKGMIAQSLMQQRGLTAEAAQQIVESRQFANLLEATTQAQLGQQMSSLNDLGRQQRREMVAVSRVNNAQNRGSRAQLTNAVRQTGLTRQVGINQSLLNQRFAEGSLITGQGLQAAQAAAQSAQLQSQRASGPSFLSQLAAYGQALAPFAQSIQPNVTTNVPSYAQNMGGAGVSGSIIGAGLGLGASYGKDFSSLMPSKNYSSLLPPTQMVTFTAPKFPSRLP